MDLSTFLTLPAEEVAALVRASGLKVCVFPINGTRRWFILEYGDQEWDDPVAAYMDIAAKRHIELYKLFFDHGIDTLITPVIGPEILATRGTYMQKIGAEGLARLATHPDFLDFYQEYGVRARFYGEYRKYLAGSPYEHLSDIFDGLIGNTRQNNRCRLFFGAFADNLNATQRVAELAVQYFQQTGTVPDQKRIVELYYGEYIGKANIFIGFDRFAAFDYPLINWGEEDLYFTVSPSMYLGPEQLRTILYDHLYVRRTEEPEYENLSPEGLERLKQFYRLNQKSTQGIGIIRDGIWLPARNIDWPEE